jgi:sulfofructosephosphate aldolase
LVTPPVSRPIAAGERVRKAALMTNETIQSKENVQVVPDRLRQPNGGFAMLALDQRESLRTMLVQGGAGSDDQAIVAFKHTAVRLLAGLTSAVLLDRPFGLVDGAPSLPPECVLIIAADELEQPRGGPVMGSDLDPLVNVELIHSMGAAALKLLVLWRAGSGKDRRDDLVGRFLDLCHRAGVASVLEGVTRPPIGQAWRSATEQQDAILATATEFSPARPSLYKAEVPGFGRLEPEELTSRARQITQVLSSPWVALSSGVKPDDFPAAVEAACRGGADGFLAGRAIWADSVGVDDVAGHLKKNATSRLEALLEAVKRGRARRE